MIRLILAMILVLLFGEAALAAQPAEQIRLTLRGALARVDSGREALADLHLDIVRRGGELESATWGYAPGYNRADHPGKVIKSEINGDSMTLDIEVVVRPDQWWTGGGARYRLVLKRQGQNLSGAYTGAINGRSVEGEVSGGVGPLLLPPVQGRFHPRPGEHPRLLFGKDDLPRLRDRLQTPLGQKLVAALEVEWKRSEGGFGYGRFRGVEQAMEATQGFHAASHGLMYLLKDDGAHANRAKELTVLAMKSGSAQDEMWTYVQKMHGVALAYDFCYHAWDEPFRQEVRTWLMRWASDSTRPRALRPQGNQSAAIVNMNAYSADLALFRAAAGFAALAVMGDQTAGTPPAVITIAPDAEAVADGVPVVRFADDQVITEWLNCSGLVEDPAWRPGVPELQQDPLAPLGSAAKFRPRVGTKVTYRGIAREFAALNDEHIFRDVYTDQRPAIALLRPEHLKGQTLEYYYTILSNDKPRLIRIDLGDRYLWAERIWINGQPVQENEVVRLEAGRYPILIEARVPTRQTYSPYFPAFYGNTQYPHRDVRRGNWHYNTVVIDGGVIKEYPKADLWMMPRLIETADPEVDPVGHAYVKKGHALPADIVATISARSVARYLEETIGENGWGAEDECDGDAIHYVLYFLQSYNHLTGTSLPAGHGLEKFIPLLVYRGEAFATEYARSVFVAPAMAASEYLPLARWVLDQTIDGWARDGGPGRNPVGLQFPEFAIYALINYPFDVQAKSPAEFPLPLTFADQSAGGFVMRSGWDDKSVSLVARGSSKAFHNACLAGTFEIKGLGTSWSRQFITKEGVIHYPQPGQYNVLLVEKTLPKAGASPIHTQFHDDGSGSITYDMSKVYWGAEPRKTNAWGVGTGNIGVDWGDKPPFDAGIRATRTIAVDYSGKCGSPALLVIVDRLNNADGRAKTWRMEVPGAGGRRGDKVLALRDGGTAEAIRRPPGNAKANTPLPAVAPEEANLRVTFAAPAGVAIDISGGQIKASSEQSLFVAVMTLQRGPAPVVRVFGEAPDLRIEVGNQVVRIQKDRVAFTP